MLRSIAPRTSLSHTTTARSYSTTPRRPPPSSSSSSPRPRPRGPPAPSRSRPDLDALPPTPDVVYEDDKFIVLNKPAGVALQGQFGSPARAHWDHLLQALRTRPTSPSVYPVHRLDKATTGTLVLTKSPVHAARLSKQLARHEVERTYLAAVYGQLRVGFRGTVENRLRVDDDKVRVVRGHEGEPDGVDARTEWECVAAS
ncbi:hypothetical protein JCM10212_005451, partial [Sporobolomyces blumeae]